MQFRGIVLVLSLLFCGDSYAYSTGAPTKVCSSMVPSPRAHGAAQTSPSPFWLSISGDGVVTPGESVTVTVTGASQAQIRGILLQAHYVNGSAIGGEFLSLNSSADFQAIDCSGDNSAVTHRSGSDKSLPVTFTWTSPKDLKEEMLFRATVMETKAIFWTNVESKAVKVESCPADQATKADSCASELVWTLTNDQSDLFMGSVDVISFCGLVERRHEEFMSCTEGIVNGCGSHLERATELYNQTSYTFCDCQAVYNCFVDPCDTSERPSCPGGMEAECISNYCGGCWVVWVDGKGDPVRCETGTPNTTMRTSNHTTPPIYPPSRAAALDETRLLIGATLVVLVSISRM